MPSAAPSAVATPPASLPNSRCNTRANDAFDDAVDAAQQVRIVAQDQAETEFLNALSEYETKRSG